MGRPTNQSIDERIAAATAEAEARVRAEMEEKIEAVLATVAATNRTTDSKGEGLSAETLGEAIAGALAKIKEDEDLFKISKGGWQPVPEDKILSPDPNSPQYYNLLEEATKRAMQLGYQLGPWHRYKAENASPLVDELPEDWIAVCQRTGATARARWHPPALKDPQERWSPQFLCDALNRPARGRVSLDQKFAEKFPGARVSMMASSSGEPAAGFTTGAVERPE